MKVVKRTEAYTIYLRGDGRYAVKGADKKPVNGDEKVRILAEENMVKVAPPPAPEPEETPAEEASADEEPVAEAAAAEETAAEETAAEETAAEETAAEETAAEEPAAEEAGDAKQ